MELSELTADEIKKLRNACLLNSRQWVTAARTLIETSKEDRNIAYSLAALALEETAKANLITIRQHSLSEKRDFTWGQKHFDDHIKKLFWALWTPMFGSEEITGNKLDELKGLATSIHKKRIACSYVSIDEKGETLPKDAVTERETLQLIEVCENRIEMEDAQSVEKLPKDLQEDLDWFLDISEDKQERSYFFTTEAMKKLAELKSPALWIKWLHKESEKRFEESKAITKEEFESKKPKGKKAVAPKWRIKVRIFSDSHTFRQSALNWWNGLKTAIKLYQVTSRKGEMMIEFTIPKKVPLASLWWAGLTYAQRFLLALNISTLGFHWWYIPRQLERYYEELEDLERNAHVVIERSPSLNVKWNGGALQKDDLWRTALVFQALPYPEEKNKHIPFDHYLTALGALAKTDVHLQFEETAFVHFFRSLKTGMKAYGHWDGDKEYSGVLRTWKDKIVPDEFDFERLLSYGESIQESRIALGPVSLKEVRQMKFICDVFFCLQFKDSAVTKKAG